MLKNTGDKIADATGHDVTLRAELGLGGRPGGLPHKVFRPQAHPDSADSLAPRRRAASSSALAIPKVTLPPGRGSEL